MANFFAIIESRLIYQNIFRPFKSCFGFLKWIIQSRCVVYPWKCHHDSSIVSNLPILLCCLLPSLHRCLIVKVVDRFYCLRPTWELGKMWQSGEGRGKWKSWMFSRYINMTCSPALTHSPLNPLIIGRFPQTTRLSASTVTKVDIIFVSSSSIMIFCASASISLPIKLLKNQLATFSTSGPRRHDDHHPSHQNYVTRNNCKRSHRIAKLSGLEAIQAEAFLMMVQLHICIIGALLNTQSAKARTAREREANEENVIIVITPERRAKKVVSQKSDKTNQRRERCDEWSRRNFFPLEAVWCFVASIFGAIWFIMSKQIFGYATILSQTEKCERARP